jgi:hypothetical protein
MSEDEIIGTFEHWIEYEKANKDKINKADELIEIQQGLLDLYQKEKEKNDDNISKDKIREKMKIIENECETCQYNHILCEERKPLVNGTKYCLKLECYDVLKSLLEEN